MSRSKFYIITFTLLLIFFGILNAASSSIIAQDTPTTYYVTGSSRANARSAPTTSATVVARLSPGTSVSVVGEVTGDAVRNNTIWYQVTINDGVAYIHSSLLSPNPPTTRTGNTQTATSVPSTNPPISAPASFACSCSRTCTQMTTCEEAYFQLNTCGCGRRDGDGDGVPCENLCPGG